MVLEIDGFASPSAIVVYNDDKPMWHHMTQFWPFDWLRVHIVNPVLPLGTVILISLQQMQPMAAQAV